MMKNNLRYLLVPALASTLLLAGCSLAPSYERPAQLGIAQWTYGAAANTEQAAAAATLDWQIFNCANELSGRYWSDCF